MMKDSVKYRIIFVTEMMKEHSVKNGITFCKTGFSFHHEWTSGMGAYRKRAQSWGDGVTMRALQDRVTHA